MIASAPGGGPLRFGKEQEIARTGIGFAGRIPAMPEQGVAPNLYLAVDPDKDAVLFATFVDRGHGTDIRLTRSDDSGRTWQAFTVNDDGTSADQFSPALTVDSENAANIVFYDTRLSSTFEAADIFLATFSHGISLGNRRITSVSSDDSRRNSRRDLTANLGDRTAIAVTRGKVVIAWTDTRLGTERIFLSIIRL